MANKIIIRIGKSSLTMSLFRIAELTQGSITIDGRDTANIPLHTLRSAIDIVAQMPVLFKGKLREFLDPLGEYEDFQLWEALEKTGMKNTVTSAFAPQENENERGKVCVFTGDGSAIVSTVTETSSPPPSLPPLAGAGAGGLNFALHEGSDNLSVGERQMLVLTRAVLRGSRILVLDEATAYVDWATDRQVRKVLDTEFLHSTVITIAHRIDSVLSSDKILVLSAGRAVEFASPQELLRRSNSQFKELAKEAGVEIDQFMSSSSACIP